jgi:hypothetical protein
MRLATMKTWFAVVCVLAACSDHSHDKLDAGGTTHDAAPDGGPFKEAAHDTPPQVVPLNGPVLTAPKVQPVFFTGDDTVQAQAEMFFSQLTGSTYWTTITNEYGVGNITFLPTIVSTATPPTTDDALQAFIAANAGGSGTVSDAGSATAWPAPDGNTIYAVFLPAGVTLSSGGAVSCQDFGGYHSEGKLSDGVTKFVYALLPRCGTGSTLIDDLTAATSHEFLEASTDPYFYTDPQYQLTDANHLIWSYTPGGELGDMCEYVDAAFQRLVGSFLVQRTWSNMSAAAGHDPCVPVMSGPYVSASPVLTGMPTLGNTITQGITVAMGEQATVEVDLFSDAPSSVDWDLKATDVGSLTGQPTSLSFSWDSTTGNNGDKLHLTITRTAASTSQNPSEFVIGSHINGISVSLWWGYVSD